MVALISTDCSMKRLLEFCCSLWMVCSSNYTPVSLLLSLRSWRDFACECLSQVTRATFSFNLWRNIVALQVERVVTHITTPCSTCHATNFSLASCSNVAQSRFDFYFSQQIFSTCNIEICGTLSMRW